MIQLDQVGWTWADGTRALENLSFEIAAGERVLITGPSGCGKSTLLRLLAGLLQHHGLGEFEGDLTVHGEDPAAWSGAQRARSLGMVFQDPADQLVSATVAGEVRFGPACAGSPVDVAAALGAVGLALHEARNPHALSGGQQQRVAVAAGLAAGGRLLVLDEPLAHLDPEGARGLLSRLDSLAAAGHGVVLVEHRVEAALPWADRVIVLREGAVVFDGVHAPPELLEGEGLEVPAMMRIDAEGGLEAMGPVAPTHHPLGAAAVEFHGSAVQRDGREVLAPLSLTLHAGERLAIVGPNGAGKSTLLAEMAKLEGAAWVPQDPDLSLFCPSVEEELSFGPKEWGRTSTVNPEDFALQGVLDASPHALSRGQRLRVAVAAAVAARPTVLLLDEPTAGQHADAVNATLSAAASHVEGPVVFATHDLALALRWATRAVVLDGGGVVASGPPHEVLHHLPLPPLQEAQAARGWPLVDVGRQLRGPVGEVHERERPHRRRTREEGREPKRRRDGSVYGPLLGVVTVGLLAVLVDRPITLACLAIVSGVALWTGPIPARRRAQISLAMVAIVWSTLFSQGLFYADLPRTAWVSVGPFTLWREGVGWGLVQSLRLIAVSSAGLAVALRVGPDRMVGALRGLGIPGGLAFLAATALRFVPVVAGEWLIVREARARRGRALWRRGPISWLRAEVYMLRPLVVRALRRARRLAESLDSRGFDAAEPPLPAPKWRRSDRVVASVCAGLLSVVVSSQSLYGLYLAEIYAHPSLGPLYAWVRAWL